MPTQTTHSVVLQPTSADSKHVTNVVAEDLKPLPLPNNARYPNSSPETRPIEVHDPILEEDEDTSSEVAEPVTPTSDSRPQSFHQYQQENDHHLPVSAQNAMNKPLIVNTAPTPPSTPNSTSSTPRPTSKDATTSSPTSPHNTRPAPQRTSSKLRTFFRRTNSHLSDGQNGSPTFDHKSNMPASALEAPPRRWSMSRSTNHSPQSSATNTPPSPGSPTSTVNSTHDKPPAMHLTDPFGKIQVRASTGLSLREKSKVVFGTTPRPDRPEQKLRSNSVTDMHKGGLHQPDISIPAQAGSGLKARRLSTSLPDNFYVDTCELNEEFTSASKIPGRKKQIGTGATATVKVMARKGDSSGSQYAVKEFRKQSQKEDEHEYEQKVKSEFSIANSLDHKNIVKTARLCTHSGRWNHVMEYCHHGDVFSLMEQKYLKHEDHVCFFKQMLHGVAYLHDHGIAHRDIKLENLLMNGEGYIKITDFGVSEVFCGIHPGLREGGGQCGKDMKECRKCSPGICGSLPYIAPEVLAKKGDYDPRPLDVWSCAIVFLTMWHGGNPWPAAERKHHHYVKFVSGWDKFLESRADGLGSDDALPKVGPIISTLPSPGMKRLLLQMLHPDPEKRISIHQAINDRWVKSIDCCCVDEQHLKDKVILDAAGKQGCKVAAKMTIKKCHNHIPPEKRRLPQHRFDMGNGWSRYD